jgi:hypothetical protein
MPAYTSGNLSKTGRPDFNYPLRPMTRDLTIPNGPKNIMVTAPYKTGATDVRWDNPKLIPQNNGLQILGVNVYRSIDNPYGPYQLVNETPVGVLFYRDETIEQLITEDVTNTLQYSTEPDGKWRVWAQNRPIIIPGSNGKVTDNITDIIVEIDDGSGTFVEVPAFTLSGKTGEVILISRPTYNQDVEQVIPPRLPYPPNGKVKLTYKYLKHSVLSRLSQRIYYKATTVAVNPLDNSKQIETPIEEVEWRSTADIEEIDWIWREAILRNRWILEQGGERAKIFVRKWMGPICPEYEGSHGQSRADCPLCYGTSILMGYSGPFEILIAPPEAEKTIDLLDMGLHINYGYMTWSGPFPIINERDVIVRQNNERYVVGPVNYQGSKGAIYQQHFTISYIDEGDIRYQIGVPGGQDQVPASTDLYRENYEDKTDPSNSRGPGQPLSSPASPVIPLKPEIPRNKILLGKTVQWENITF